ncbi:SDR family NAD(P)-dependent oxidoreductase [Corallococcus exiguus]|nr:SDR family NAD(P)-dependent oxidoreductase [Corallococcus exiguus]RKH96082.1 SDR family NAD(P)-dependent oxidoreductase [Corallococcus sp. AB038B]
MDALLNNAGIGYFAAVEESEDREVRRMLEFNLFGLAAITNALLPGLRARRSGTILNVSSVSGLRRSQSWTSHMMRSHRRGSRSGTTPTTGSSRSSPRSARISPRANR